MKLALGDSPIIFVLAASGFRLTVDDYMYDVINPEISQQVYPLMSAQMGTFRVELVNLISEATS